MKNRRVLFGLWILFSVLFIAFIAVRNSDKLKRDFEQASIQQHVELERTKEKAAPLAQLLRLTALAVGVPLGILGLGAILIWAARRSASQNTN